MPRPGPRPYECVRRAWHSDRHQPMRGSIIQQIFRVVHESHTAGTKKNREWQEKLPLVVLKSEEIMYSKANSEAEYIDPETLWDRVNDAINTIIRKDESMETGDLLPPCVEAALNLGCVPVRASRSQRNSNPRNYLSPRAQDSGSIPSTSLDNAANARNPNLQNSERPMPMAQMQANRNIMQNYKNIPCASGNFALSGEKFPLSGTNRFVSGESKASLDMGSVYPLYYGVHSQPEVSPMGFHCSKRSNTLIVGMPIYQAISEPPEKDCLQNLFRDHEDENARISQSEFRINHEKEPESMEFDLSLRLGPLSEPCLRNREISTCNNHEICPSNSQERSPQSKEFSFFPMPSTANEPVILTGWNFEGEGQNVDAAVRKRKVVVPDNTLKDGQFFWQLESTSNQMKSELSHAFDELELALVSKNTDDHGKKTPPVSWEAFSGDTNAISSWEAFSGDTNA